MRTFGLMLAALLAAALLSACSTGPGPLGNAGDGMFTECTPAPPGQTVTMGIWWLHNDGTSPVTIQSIHLDEHDLRMTMPWLVPIYHNPKNGQFDEVGAGYPYPPAFNVAARWSWARRQPAVGALIRPSKSLNLVFGMTRTSAATGRAGGPVIVYSAGGTTYTLAEKTAETLVTNC